MTPTIYSNNQGWLPSIFNDFFNDSWMPVTKFSGTTPAINVSEDDKEFKVEVAAPGMNKQDFNIQVNNEGEMVISMEKKTQSDNADEAKKTQKYLRREFSYSKFQQTLTLPDNVKKEDITASMNDGVLTIDIPKMTEEQKAKELQYIEIK